MKSLTDFKTGCRDGENIGERLLYRCGKTTGRVTHGEQGDKAKSTCQSAIKIKQPNLLNTLKLTTTGELKNVHKL